MYKMERQSALLDIDETALNVEAFLGQIDDAWLQEIEKESTDTRA